MTRTLAIDPGPVQSAYVLLDDDTRRPIEFGKAENDAVRGICHSDDHDFTVIEMVASYGMAVGAEVFETCVWVGRFAEIVHEQCEEWALVKRQPVKVHHCKSATAKDSNIVQALIDRFAAGEPNRGKGTKAKPGWFYGFRADVWQAYALGVYAVDVGLAREIRTGVPF